jgi:pimeloyl-ACP methyl ester carboxylesterase
MLAATAVLLHSPFLGPASLRPLAGSLAARGHPAVVLDLRPSIVTPPVHQVLVGAFADAIGDAAPSGPVVLVGHSGAGPLLPAFADALEESVAGLVFLDAGLPTPGRSWRDTVPPELYTPLRDRSRDGLLPRWHTWFVDEPLANLVTDPDLRAEIEDETPEVPLAFLKEARPDVEWSGPAGYVALSSAYEPDLEQAESRGWPTVRLQSHHLAPATDPDPVAEAVLRVLTEILSQPAG